MRKLILLILILFSASGNTQQAFTNSGNLQIHGTASLTAFGDFTNAASGSFVNNGSFYEKGSLTNNQASMSTGAGTLYLNGSAAQSVNGTQTFKTNNLVSNNAAGIMLNNNLSVSGTHSFTAGNISSASNTNFLIYQTGANYTGATDAQHVNGWVKKLGTTSFTFPVGNSTYLREITVSNLTGSPEFNVQYSGATTNTSNLQSPLLSVDPYEYWTVNEVSGSGATAQVTLNWDKSKVNFPNWSLLDIRAAQYTGGYWISKGGSATGSPSTTGTITSIALSSFGPMVIGSTSLVLPLLFLDLHATWQPEYTTVVWKTTSEENVQRMEVQKSINGVDFTTIGSVAGRNRKETELYTYNDVANKAVSYYRIKSIDFDGKIIYSKIVAVSPGAQAEALSLLNNPVTNQISLLANGAPAANYHYQLLAADGRVVLKGSIRYEGSGNMNFRLNNFIPPGTYLLSIGHQKNYLFKIVVQ